MKKIQTNIFLCSLWLCLCAQLGMAQHPHQARHKTTHLESSDPLRKLKIGNAHFQRNALAHPNQSIIRRVKLAREGQHPYAIILSCSDSRVPPELVFDTGLGDLFVIRVAGNIINENVLGSVEYAAEHLGAKLVIVLGHENCGAVAAAVAGTREAHVTSLVEAIKPAVTEVLGNSPAPSDEANRKIVTNKAVKANVELMVAQLKQSEPLLAKMAGEGHLKIMGGYYHLESGKVDFLSGSQK